MRKFHFLWVVVILWLATITYQHLYYAYGFFHTEPEKLVGYAAHVEKHNIKITPGIKLKNDPKPTPNPKYANSDGLLDYVLGCDIACP